MTSLCLHLCKHTFHKRLVCLHTLIFVQFSLQEHILVIMWYRWVGWSPVMAVSPELLLSPTHLLHHWQPHEAIYDIIIMIMWGLVITYLVWCSATLMANDKQSITLPPHSVTCNNNRPPNTIAGHHSLVHQYTTANIVDLGTHTIRWGQHSYHVGMIYSSSELVQLPTPPHFSSQTLD